MKTSNIISLYFALSAVNSIIPVGIALLFSASWGGVLVIWALATAVTFSLICLVCLPCALKENQFQTKQHQFQGDIERAFS